MPESEHEKKIAIAVRHGPERGDPVLSVRQPWALMIVEQWKPIENRTWTTQHRGLVWIHAATAQPDRDWWRDEGWKQAEQEMGIPKRELDSWEFDYGAVIGAAFLANVYPRELLPRPLSGNVHAVGPYCWHFTAADRLETPVPLRGRQGLFVI